MLRKTRKNRLRVVRAERDITQMDLALKAGLSRDRYWRIENGYDSPSDSELSRLAKALKVQVDALGFPTIEAKAS